MQICSYASMQVCNHVSTYVWMYVYTYIHICPIAAAWLSKDGARNHEGDYAYFSNRPHRHTHTHKHTHTRAQIRWRQERQEYLRFLFFFTAVMRPATSGKRCAWQAAWKARTRSKRQQRKQRPAVSLNIIQESIRAAIKLLQKIQGVAQLDELINPFCVICPRGVHDNSCLFLSFLLSFLLAFSDSFFSVCIFAKLSAERRAEVFRCRSSAHVSSQPLSFSSPCLGPPGEAGKTATFNCQPDVNNDVCSFFLLAEN